MMAQNTRITKEDFHALLAGKIPITEFPSAKIYAIVKSYPYYETAYKFYLKRLRLEDQKAFQDALSEAATCINMNEQFWQFVHAMPTSEQEVMAKEVQKEVVELDEGKDDTNQASASAVEPNEPPHQEEVNEIAKPEEQEQVTLDTNETDDLNTSVPSEQKQDEDEEDVEKQDTRRFKRKIKDGYEHMGENLAATISSQMDLAKPKEDEKIQYSPDLYFIDEKDGEGEPLTLADVKRLSASPVQEVEPNNGFLEIDESERVEQAKTNKSQEEVISEDKSGDLLDLEENASKQKKNPKSAEVFDIREYADEEVEEGDDLISKFIKSNPRLAPADVEEEKESPEYVEELAQKSVSEDKALVSEPLIEVFIKQGYYEKAIDAFQQLSLNNPEKSAYFARRIKNLKEIIKKHKK